MAAVRDHGVLSLAWDEALGRIQTRNRLAYEGEVGRVHGLEPIDHLILSHECDGDFGLRGESINIMGQD